MGWYSANPVDLDSLPEEKSAKKLMEYLGLDSTEAIIAKAREDFEAGEYQWVAQIMKQVIYADPTNGDARNLCADALEQLGDQAESGTWRNAYLTGAYELRNGNSAAQGQSAGGMKNTIAEWSVRMMFYNLAVSSDANAVQNDDVEFNLTVTDLGEITMAAVLMVFCCCLMVTESMLRQLLPPQRVVLHRPFLREH